MIFLTPADKNGANISNVNHWAALRILQHVMQNLFSLCPPEESLIIIQWMMDTELSVSGVFIQSKFMLQVCNNSYLAYIRYLEPSYSSQFPSPSTRHAVI
jgi:hypothetical protein